MIRRNLEQLDREGKAIKVGIVGLGAMGAGTLSMLQSTAGIRCVAAADLDVQRLVSVFESIGYAKEDLAITDDIAAAEIAAAHGKPVLTGNGLMLSNLDIDVILEATGSASFGARVAYEAILNGKHIVMLTVETDVLVGPILARLAESAGVVYTLAAGDQPGAILELYHWANTLGLDVIAAGRGCFRFPEDRYQGPHEDRRGRSWISENPKMANSFRDGTKAQIEMAAVSNATGLVPDIRGMHEPFAPVSQLSKIFRLKEHGGILNQTGVIEIANAVNDEGTWIKEDQVGDGVFLVIDSADDTVQKYLHQFFGRTSPRGGVLFRPYHMTCLEVPISIARAALYGVETAKPSGLYTEVVAAAKRDLEVGQVLDGGGGSTVYSLVEKAAESRRGHFIPVGLTAGAKLTKAVSKDQILSFSDVEVETDLFVDSLRNLQAHTFLETTP